MKSILRKLPIRVQGSTRFHLIRKPDANKAASPRWISADIISHGWRVMSQTIANCRVIPQLKNPFAVEKKANQKENVQMFQLQTFPCVSVARLLRSAQRSTSGVSQQASERRPWLLRRPINAASSLHQEGNLREHCFRSTACTSSSQPVRNEAFPFAKTPG